VASGSYAVIRYLPSRERDEPRNIGIILASNAPRDLLVKMTAQPQNTRLTNDQRNALQGFVHGLGDQLRAQMAGDKPEEFLQQIVHGLANSLVATEPRPIVFDDSTKALDQLFETLVKPQVPWLGKELLMDVVGALRERQPQGQTSTKPKSP
jgi:hypothetical protein